MKENRLGVYICHCGGNISDYVDVKKVLEAIRDEEGVVVAKTVLFACSDASQQEMIEDIQNHNLNGLVVASCSPKLHLFTFRSVAERAGLNPYRFVHVNIREQDSWAHTDDPKGATEKAIRLVRAGIAKARHCEPLEPIKLDTVGRVMVIGGGVAGMKAALALRSMGLEVVLVEKEKQLGGWVRKFRSLYPAGNGEELVAELEKELRESSGIEIITGGEVIEKSGRVGDFQVKVRVDGQEKTYRVGGIIVATGFELYRPSEGEFGYGEKGVLTLQEFKEKLEQRPSFLDDVSTIAFIYCVGSRQSNGNSYCSRFCCNATLHTCLEALEKKPELKTFHIYRDIRAYGKYEALYEEAQRKGSVFLRYSQDNPPKVEERDGKLVVSVKDRLTCDMELELEADMVVLVTGMVARQNQKLVDVLKLPVGADGFYNEVHPKLRPVETVIDGLLIAGTAQGPKNLAETVCSAMAASAKAAAFLKKGFVKLEPQLAVVDPERCIWCGECEKACPYGAIVKRKEGDKEVAAVEEAFCKGCGACVPVCDRGAIYLRGYEDETIFAMIDALLKEV